MRVVMKSDLQDFPPWTAEQKAGCAPSCANPAEEIAAPQRRKVLILDDDAEFLSAYRDLLSRLPSRPEVHTASSAPRAFALLESEPFTLLITDLRMPKIDGFQVLMSVRRRFPAMRTVVLTGIADEQYRARAYGMGIDLYTEKPASPGEIRLFTQCIEGLLTREESARGGLRGVQSKTMLDLVQSECLSQNSSVLRVTNGALEAKIWIEGGDVIDAELKDLRGEEAFKSAFAWKSGSFEMLPGEPARERTIFSSHHALLLDSAQALDEAGAQDDGGGDDAPAPGSPLAPLARVPGVESLLAADAEDAGAVESWGVENAAHFAEWARRAARDFGALGASLNAGALSSIETRGSTRHLALLARGPRLLLAGLDRALPPKQMRETLQDIAARWEP